MAIFNPKHLDSIIQKVGNTVVLYSKTDVQYDDWGNEFSSTSGVSTIAVVNDISKEDENNVEGVLVSGDKIFFFKSTETNLTENGIISFENVNYNIVKVIPYKVENISQQYEVWAKRT